MSSTPRIFVVGSLNLDLLQTVARFPQPGETISGDEIVLSSGGKGSNQARAAARLGAPVTLIGKTGDDAFGQMLRATLAADGLDLSAVALSRHATGTAVVLLLPDGENSIVISPGANGDLTPQEAIAGLHDIAPGDLLLCQLEVPLATVHAALEFATTRGALTILDPAPAQPLPTATLCFAKVLTPNETEAAVVDTSSSEILIEKLGAAGCRLTIAGQARDVPGFRVSPVLDTTGAGDIFNGALAVALSRMTPPDFDWMAALRFANAAAALSVTRRGAGDSAPSLPEVEKLLHS
jgi:ribokinase